jgi:hypothetical protein
MQGIRQKCKANRKHGGMRTCTPSPCARMERCLRVAVVLLLLVAWAMPAGALLACTHKWRPICLTHRCTEAFGLACLMAPLSSQLATAWQCEGNERPDCVPTPDTCGVIYKCRFWVPWEETQFQCGGLLADFDCE